MRRCFAVILLVGTFLFSFSIAAQEEIPEPVAKMLDIALDEFTTLNLEPISKTNKYSVWYYNDQRRIGWSAAFAAWCAEQAGLTMFKEADAAPDIPADATIFPMETKVVLQCQAFEKAGRLGDVPRPGYAVIYGVIGGTPYTHFALVETARELEDGTYEITTLEGNISDTIKRYCFRYDQAPKRRYHNMSVVPEEERTVEGAQYDLDGENWCITGFGQTYLPDEMPRSEEDTETTGGK